jgi:hypothetical protein
MFDFVLLEEMEKTNFINHRNWVSQKDLEKTKQTSNSPLHRKFKFTKQKFHFILNLNKKSTFWTTVGYIGKFFFSLYYGMICIPPNL